MPLAEALAHRFHSIEADVWLIDNALRVAHRGDDIKGTLNELYMAPLAKRIAEHGSVYDDGLTFYLWIDIKHWHPNLGSILFQELQTLSTLTQYGSNGIREGPISIVLTGNEQMKKALVSGCDPCIVTRDSNRFRFDDPPADHRWLWYSLRWHDLFNWTGDAEPAPGLRDELQQLVEKIHEKGRRVRFYGVPDNIYSWQVAWEAGVDLINTDRLQSLADYLSNLE